MQICQQNSRGSSIEGNFPTRNTCKFWVNFEKFKKHIIEIEKKKGKSPGFRNEERN